MTVPASPDIRKDPLDDTLLYDHGTERDGHLNALLRLTAPVDARIEIVKLGDDVDRRITSLFGLDSHDDTPVEIYRFPGAPDAYAGKTRGMMSYDAWLYFGGAGQGKQITFPRGIDDHPRWRYKLILSTTVGRPVEFDD